MIDFSTLVNVWTEEGARAIWSILVCQCVKSHFPEAREIRPSQGDEGVDTFAGDLSGTPLVWQSKFFWKEVGDSQKNQIRSSFKTVMESAEVEKLKKWHLCIPISLSVKETKWFEKWKKDNEKKYQIKIMLWDRSDFLRFYSNKELKPIFDLAFNKSQAISVENFRSQLKESYELEIKKLEDKSVHENAVFVLKLIAANVTNHRSARTAFYNFELLKRKLEEGSDEEDKQRIISLSETIYSLWEAEFNKLQAGEYGKDFYLKFLSVLESKKIDLDLILKVHKLHNEGAIHSWADQCEAGWLEHFKIDVVIK